MIVEPDSRRDFARRILKAEAGRNYGGNVSGLVTATAKEAKRQAALEWLLQRSGAAPMSDSDRDRFLAEIDGKPTPRKRRRRDASQFAASRSIRARSWRSSVERNLPAPACQAATRRPGGARAGHRRVVACSVRRLLLDGPETSPELPEGADTAPATVAHIFTPQNPSGRSWQRGALRICFDGGGCCSGSFLNNAALRDP